MNKTINLTKETWKKLIKIKYYEELDTIEDVIKYLLKRKGYKQ